MAAIIAFLSSSLGDSTEKSNVLLAHKIVDIKKQNEVEKLFYLLNNAVKKI